MTRREWVLTAIVAMGAGATGFGYRAWRASGPEEDENTIRAIAATELPGIDGKPQALRQWRGKLLVVNFWATWCTPCREEIPLFIRLQERFGTAGLQFVGIALDEPTRVRVYANELGINFPLLIAGTGGIELSRAMGNRSAVLPFSVVVRRDGVVAARHIGAFKQDQLEKLLDPLLKR